MRYTEPRPTPTPARPLSVAHDELTGPLAAEVVASLPLSYAVSASTSPVDVYVVDGGHGWPSRARCALGSSRAVVIIDPVVCDPADVVVLHEAALAAGALVGVSETHAGNPALPVLRSTVPDGLKGLSAVFVSVCSRDDEDPDLILAQVRVLRALGLVATGVRRSTGNPGGVSLTASAGGTPVVGSATRSAAVDPYVRVTAVSGERTVDIVLPGAATARPATVEVTTGAGTLVLPTLYETAHRATLRAMHGALSDGGECAVGGLEDLVTDLATVTGAAALVPHRTASAPGAP